MLVGYLKFEIHAAGNYHKVKKNIEVMLQSGLSLSLSLTHSLSLSLSLSFSLSVKALK